MPFDVPTRIAGLFYIYKCAKVDPPHFAQSVKTMSVAMHAPGVAIVVTRVSIPPPGGSV
jgi:hypothetical protein